MTKYISTICLIIAGVCFYISGFLAGYHLKNRRCRMIMNTDNDWLKKRAEQEDGCFVSVGGLVEALEGNGREDR